MFDKQDNLRNEELERLRKIFLKEKLQLLEANKVTCYAELKTDSQKYWYRKLTTALRTINKRQDEIKNFQDEIKNFEAKTLKVINELHELKAPKSDKSLPLTFTHYKETILPL